MYSGDSKVLQYLGTSLRYVYHLTEAVQAMVGSLVEVGTLTRCALLLYVKTAQVNMQRGLIREFFLYEFKLGQIAAEAAQNICWTKGERAVVHSSVTRRLDKVRWV